MADYTSMLALHEILCRFGMISDVYVKNCMGKREQDNVADALRQGWLEEGELRESDSSLVQLCYGDYDRRFLYKIINEHPYPRLAYRLTKAGLRRFLILGGSFEDDVQRDMMLAYAPLITELDFERIKVFEGNTWFWPAGHRRERVGEVAKWCWEENLCAFTADLIKSDYMRIEDNPAGKTKFLLKWG